MQRIIIYPESLSGLDHFYCPFSGIDLIASFENERFPKTLAFGWSGTAPEVPFCDKYQLFAGEEADFDDANAFIAEIEKRKQAKNITNQWYLFELAPSDSPFAGDSVYMCLEIVLG